MLNSSKTILSERKNSMEISKTELMPSSQDLFSVSDNFFVISSDNLEPVHTRLYGYCISNSQVIVDTEDIRDGKYSLSPEEAYVYIERQDDSIFIYQDFVGCYGLYLYREGDYWAISNSFIYLLDYVKKSHKITFNKEYADLSLISDVCVSSYLETLVNEIRCLDRSAVVKIDIKSKTIETSLLNYMENTVDVDSKEGMQLLDSWFFKWTNLIKNLKRSTNNISTDLSGGYDSRLVLGLFLGSGINMNDIHVISHNDGLHSHSEDFKIATELADFYGFKLNDSSHLSKGGVNLSLLDTINNSFNLKLGFHTQMYWQCRKNEDYKYGSL